MAADLFALTVDREALSLGEWVPVSWGSQEFEIKTRGYTEAYKDGLNALRREAARELNRKVKPGQFLHSPETLPPSVDDKLQGQAIAKHCVQDVRGLYNGKDANGQPVPVTVEQFRELLSDPQGRTVLLSLAIQAAGQVGNDREEQRKAAEGNSLPVSNTSLQEAS